MDIRPLRSEADYTWALSEIERYFTHEPVAGSADADRFDVLADLIAAYESRNWPIPVSDPVEAIQYRMELGGFQSRDLAKVLGSKSRASEILNRKRALTLDMVAALNREWGIPADLLVQPYRLDAA
jgi:HTH-type transcriptional regulator/antitoxin HigA